MADADGKASDLTTNNGKRWSVVENNVESDILEDMGVKMLEDEENICNNKNTNKSTAKDSKSSSGQSAKGSNETRLQPHKKDQRLNNDITEEFFLFRRKQPVHARGEDVFSKLSDEMVLMIFRWLPKNMLVRCSLVCKRWQRIAYDEVLWTRMDLSSRALNSGSLGHLLARGSIILRLAQAEISDPVFLNSCHLLNRDIHCKLQYLDLSMSVISENGLAKLLSICRSLRKLSLEHCIVNEDVCAAIGRNQNLDVLNMSACYGVTEKCLRSIVNGCRKMTSLNVAWTNLSLEALNTLCNELPSTIQRINISGCRNSLSDDHVEQLISSCPDLVELDLSDCTKLTSKTIELIRELDKVEHLALSRCYSISPSSYMQLQSVNSLMFLDVFNLMNEQSLASLQQSLPEVDINKFLFSSVARPTVGIRRTSIWGLRVRD